MNGKRGQTCEEKERKLQNTDGVVEASSLVKGFIIALQLAGNSLLRSVLPSAFYGHASPFRHSFSGDITPMIANLQRTSLPGMVADDRAGSEDAAGAFCRN